ncbi:hypothetical protein [Haloarcula rubripromontorii]|uniref:hypothetical protein n=1 Tax=Haloarcula rubripromontorii TaxID=1705562 RepID=UPI00345C24D8
MISELPESVSINDAAGFPVAALGAVVATGIGSVTLFGHDLAGSVAEVGISIAAALYIISFLVAWITNDRSLDEFRDGRSDDRDLEEILVLGAPALLLVHEFVPEVASAVTGDVYIGSTVALVLVGAYALVAHY